MGYSTIFSGVFKLDRPLKAEHAAYLRRFTETRRMKRDANIAVNFPDPVRIAVELPIGNEGEYFVGGIDDHDESVINGNNPPGEQPGLWCHWVPGGNDDTIEWDEGEIFYKHKKWIKYLIVHFIAPWGYILNGEVKWQGEHFQDTGIILIKNNSVEITDIETLYKNQKQELLEKDQRIRELEQKVKELEATNLMLQLEIDYRPGGKGAIEAQTHFESCAK